MTRAVLSSLSGDDALAIGAIGRGIDAILMSLENGEGSPGVRVPDPRRIVIASCGDDALPSGLYAVLTLF